MKIFKSSLGQALALGVLSGMRTTAGLNSTRFLVEDGPGRSSLTNFFRKKSVAVGAVVFGMAELVGDKLPSTPDRTAKGGLLFRAATGAVCGAAVCQSTSEKAVKGVVVGSLAAVASAYLFLHLRKTVGKKTGIPDPFIGVAEDALVIAGGLALIANK